MKTKKLLRRGWPLFGVSAVAIIGAALALGMSPAPASGATGLTNSSGVQALSATFEHVASEASPAVVHIRVEKDVEESPAGYYYYYNGPQAGSGNPQNFFRQFFGPGFGMPAVPGPSARSQFPVPVGEGSGFIISSNGYIVTNNHVAHGADRLKVTLADGRVFDAKVVGLDPKTDIALLKVNAKGLPTLSFGNSDHLRVGEWVMAIGCPFGLSHSVTTGIVSARGRGNVGIVDYADFIQTDAAINPGNSGGPLLDMNGNVIGMNTAIVSHTGASDGVGFAIPANMIKYVVSQLRQHGSVTRGFLGVSIQSLTPDLAQWFKVNKGHGVLIASVSNGSPADRAGLRRDDVITQLDGQPVGEIGAFRSRIATTPVGTKVDLTIVRNGRKMVKTVDLGSLPSDRIAMAGSDHPSGQHQVKLGITVQGMTNQLAERLGYTGEKGVVVSSVAPGSVAAQAGIKAGELIKEVNRKNVDNPREFREALQSGRHSHSTVLLLLQNGAESEYVALEVA